MLVLVEGARLRSIPYPHDVMFEFEKHVPCRLLHETGVRPVHEEIAVCPVDADSGDLSKNIAPVLTQMFRRELPRPRSQPGELADPCAEGSIDGRAVRWIG